VKVCFDTSVLVTALVDQLPNHRVAFECLVEACGRGRPVVSTHALAECYATLTALPLPRRIAPTDARVIISEGLEKKLSVLPLDHRSYQLAIERVASRGLTSGVVYDALHLHCAEATGCTRLYTFNLAHFLRLDPQGVQILAP